MKIFKRRRWDVFNRFRRVKDRVRDVPITLVGKFREWQVNRTGKPMVFVDQTGFRYWQYPGDSISFNYQRRAVGDSIGVQKYICRCVSPGSACIDVGSCIGSISVPLWSMAGKEGKVISVEADPDNIERLAGNLRLNGYPDKWILNAAITDCDGIIRLRRFAGQNGWQTIGNPAFAENVPSVLIEVKAMRLQTVMSKYELDRVDFIKVDVEGAEPMVLEGMREALTQRRISQVLFEVNHLMLQGTGCAVEGLMAFWTDFDYRLFKVGVNGEALLLSDGRWPDSDIGDCVAIAEG